MGSEDAKVVRCAWCRKRMAEGAEVCPHCGRAVEREGLRPLGRDAGPAAGDEGLDPWAWAGDESQPAGRPAPPGSLDGSYRVEPLEPAEGQEPETSWKYISGLARADKVFAAVLVILALKAMGSVVSLSILGLIVSGAILWGVLSFQWWGFLLAICFGLLDLMWALVGLGTGMVSAVQSGTIGLGFVISGISVVVNAFIVIVLFTRRGRFG